MNRLARTVDKNGRDRPPATQVDGVRSELGHRHHKIPQPSGSRVDRERRKLRVEAKWNGFNPPVQGSAQNSHYPQKSPLRLELEVEELSPGTGCSAMKAFSAAMRCSVARTLPVTAMNVSLRGNHAASPVADLVWTRSEVS